MDYRISVSTIFQGRNYPDAGDVLYSVLNNNLDKQDRIILDFKDVTLVPSMFLNTSLGKIIGERGAGIIRQKIAFSNISASQIAHIREYVQRFEQSC